MLTRSRVVAVAAVAAFALVWVLTDFGTASALLVMVVLIAALAYGAAALAQGQTEWFGRDQERRDSNHARRDRKR